MTSTRRVAVITGGSKGIGRETAHALAADGWDIALCSRDSRDAETTALEIASVHGVSSYGARADIIDSGAMDEFASEVARQWTGVDLLVCNAAVLGPVGSVPEVPAGAIESALLVNVVGTTNSIRSFWPLLSRSDVFRIIALAGGGLGGPGQMTRAPAYVPSKAAVVSLVEIISDDVVEAGGTINAIAPGNIPTSFMRSVLDAGESAAGETLFTQAREREGRPIGDSLSHFLSLLRFIASPESAPISGRFLSARWNSPDQLRAIINVGLTDNLFRLRRIDNDLYLEQN